jgi:hypothetical protein
MNQCNRMLKYNFHIRLDLEGEINGTALCITSHYSFVCWFIYLISNLLLSCKKIIWLTCSQSKFPHWEQTLYGVTWNNTLQKILNGIHIYEPYKTQYLVSDYYPRRRKLFLILSFSFLYHFFPKCISYYHSIAYPLISIWGGWFVKIQNILVKLKGPMWDITILNVHASIENESAYIKATVMWSSEYRWRLDW